MDYKEQLESALRGSPRSVHRAQQRPAKNRPVHIEHKPKPRDRRLDVSSILGIVVFIVTLVPLMLVVTPLVRFVSTGRDRAFRRFLASTSALGVLAATVLLVLAYRDMLPYWHGFAVAFGGLLVRVLVLPCVLFGADTAAKHPFVRWR